jgi:peptidoglycan/xylan/chitin deacetylase (PgdA/CDA1 family)
MPDVGEYSHAGPPRRRVAVAGLVARLLQVTTMVVAICSLGVAALAWIHLSQPFDPPQLAPVTVPAATDTSVPSYPGAITVLTYHDVADRSPMEKTLDRRNFSEHMATLSALGYQTVTLATVRDLVRHKPVRLPPRPLLLTFDDGSLTTWTTIDPVLKRYHFTAVAFLTTDLLVGPGTPSYFLSTRQVRELQETGRWEFGSHTAGMDRMVPIPGEISPPLTNRISIGDGAEDVAQWRARVSADLARSQQRLKKITGSSAIALSYPFGDAGSPSNVPQVAAELPVLLERTGFDIAFVGENVPTGHIDAVTDSSPRWLLPRIGVRRTTSTRDLLDSIRTSIPTPMPARLTDLRWASKDTECTVAPTAITVRVKTGNYGTCALREVNTSRWSDYSLQTSIQGISPKTTVVVGVRDGGGSGHYGSVELAFGTTRMIIRQRVGDDPVEELLTVPLPHRTKTELTVDVRGNVVTVHVTGRQSVVASFDSRLHEGGVTLAHAGTGAVIFQNPTLTNKSTP